MAQADPLIGDLLPASVPRMVVPAADKKTKKKCLGENQLKDSVGSVKIAGLIFPIPVNSKIQLSVLKFCY